MKDHYSSKHHPANKDKVLKPRLDYEELKKLDPDDINGKISMMRDRVEWLLYTFPETRDSDGVLLVRYYEMFHTGPGFKYSSIEDMPMTELKYLPSTATIVRSRRLFQSNGHFLPTNPDVVKARRLQEFVVREYVLNPDIPRKEEEDDSHSLRKP